MGSSSKMALSTEPSGWLSWAVRGDTTEGSWLASGSPSPTSDEDKRVFPNSVVRLAVWLAICWLSCSSCLSTMNVSMSERETTPWTRLSESTTTKRCTSLLTMRSMMVPRVSVFWQLATPSKRLRLYSRASVTDMSRLV